MNRRHVFHVGRASANEVDVIWANSLKKDSVGLKKEIDFLNRVIAVTKSELAFVLRYNSRNFGIGVLMTQKDSNGFNTGVLDG